MRSIFLCTFIGLLQAAFQLLPAQPIREYMDLQIHPTMHQAYGFFEEGLVEASEKQREKFSWKHQFRNANYVDFFRDNPGARIFSIGALLPEVGVRRKNARAKIVAQFEYVREFVRENPEDFVIAHSPEEVRRYVHTTDKAIFIFSIEGAKKLVDSQEDADFWAEQGVAFMTLIHLMDDEHGGAAIRPDLSTKFINLPGTIKKWLAPKKRRGLTEKGKEAIRFLANAGIMTDLTHMSPETRTDALDFMAENNIPPIVTHDLFRPIQNQPRGIDREDMIRIYAQGGFTSLPISGISNTPHNPYPEFRAKLDSLDCHCEGSVDSYLFTYKELKNFLHGEVWRLEGDPNASYEDLSEEEKVRYAIGFQTDVNGWLNHSHPRYGKDGCFEVEEGGEYEEIELIGMPHTGLLDSQWRYMEKQGADLEPIRRASERFLQVWEGLRAKRGTF